MSPELHARVRRVYSSCVSWEQAQVATNYHRLALTYDMRCTPRKSVHMRWSLKKAIDRAGW